MDVFVSRSVVFKSPVLPGELKVVRNTYFPVDYDATHHC